MDRKRSAEGSYRRTMSYSSPRRQTVRSGSPVCRRRSSPTPGTHPYKSPPKRRQSRSKSPSRSAKRKFSKENCSYTARRSRSYEDRKRKYEDKVKKPIYRGPENCISIDKEMKIFVNPNRDASPVRPVSSPTRVVVVRSGGKLVPIALTYRERSLSWS